MAAAHSLMPDTVLWLVQCAGITSVPASPQVPSIVGQHVCVVPKGSQVTHRRPLPSVQECFIIIIVYALQL
jgi:hypothetical protein